ncbi:ROK family protein [Dyadobacter psychrotolerans]|uniref:ROK family protein n=1 Tax=Dyadobacter psychrotolerans TaxID=2541721 RepID=A0A4R5DEU8_9BACT|nr:ROK family protein [Dyadobacter psychrotolerans]TDE11667.1 ROK family protein [Dyadobacter psychrotolerans]
MNIGVDIGGTNLRAGIELGGAITRQHKVLLENKDSLSSTLSQLMDLIRPLTKYPVKGIGIGVPSVVNVDKGIVYNVMNIPSWEEVALRDIVQKEFNLPVSINNDVNCFILGEHRYGLAKKYNSVVGMAIGTGLGSGIIIDNNLYSGNNCGAGEIGMLPYRDSILENYVCNRFFEESLGTDAFEAHEAALRGDPHAIEVWKEFGKHLGAVVKTVMYTYDPEAIVFGGSITKASRFFKASMLDSLKDFAYPNSIKHLTLLLSENENIALLGAAALLGK